MSPVYEIEFEGYNAGYVVLGLRSSESEDRCKDADTIILTKVGHNRFKMELASRTTHQIMTTRHT